MLESVEKLKEKLPMPPQEAWVYINSDLYKLGWGPHIFLSLSSDSNMNLPLRKTGLNFPNP